MNKTELVALMAEEAGLSKKDAEKALTAFISGVQNAVKAGDKVSLIGFGTFEVKKKMERISVNPSTQQRMLIPPKLVLTYKPSITLKEKFK